MAERDSDPKPRHPPLRVIVPPSRSDVHPLRTMLARSGAETLEAPALRATTPSEPRWDDAIALLASCHIVVISGAPSAAALLDALHSSGAEARLEAIRVAAIGGGALGVLRRAGIRVDVVPRRHTADEVADELGELPGKQVLLIRVEGAEPSLPDAIVSRGGSAVSVPGYRMIVDATTPEMDRVATERWDVVAFANPTAVRHFRRALDDRGMEVASALPGVRVAVAGPATAEAARRGGMAPDWVAEGTLRDLVELIVERGNDSRR